jgi:hypothetical protein
LSEDEEAVLLYLLEKNQPLSTLDIDTLNLVAAYKPKFLEKILREAQPTATEKGKEIIQNIIDKLWQKSQ